MRFGEYNKALDNRPSEDEGKEEKSSMVPMGHWGERTPRRGMNGPGYCRGGERKLIAVNKTKAMLNNDLLEKK